MEDWRHVTTTREVVSGEDSPVEKCSTRAGGIRERRRRQRQVNSDQSPHGEEQSKSKDGILQK